MGERIDDIEQALTTIPINPERLRVVRERWDPKDYPGDAPIVPTCSFSVASDMFVFLREMARMFFNGTEWNKKARIVLEYDPQAARMVIKTFMERDEATPAADRQSLQG